MTLVEVMFALFIAVLLIAGILSSVIFASRQFTEAKALTDATNIVNQQIEDLRSLTFSDLKTALAVPPNGSSAASPATPLAVRVGNQPFSVSRSSRFATATAGGAPTVNTNLIETTVTVSWVVLGRPHRASTTTSFSQYGYAAKS